MSYEHLRNRIFGVPLLVHWAKLQTVLRGPVGFKLGLDGAVATIEHQAPPERQLGDGARRVGWHGVVLEDGIGVLSIVGPLAHRVRGMSALSGGPTDYSALRETYRELQQDPRVKAILLDVDSPGGEASTVFDLADEIRSGRSAKPVWAVANEFAASAAYALASAAERLYVPRTGGVGSIGVYSLHLDQSRADEDAGLRYTYVHAGKNKVAGNSHAPLDDETRARLQAGVDRVMGLFVATVAENRGMSELEVRATDAEVFEGEDAVIKGLADVVGTFDDALADLRAHVSKTEEHRMNLEQLQAENDVLKATNEALGKTTEALQAELAELRKAEAARAEEAVEAYVTSLSDRAVAAGASPLDADQLANVRKAFKVDGAIARQLGEAYLGARCEAAKQGEAKKQSLDPESEKKAADQKKRREFIDGLPGKPAEAGAAK